MTLRPFIYLLAIGVIVGHLFGAMNGSAIRNVEARLDRLEAQP